MFPVLDFDPVLRPTGLTGPVTMLRDEVGPCHKGHTLLRNLEIKLLLLDVVTHVIDVLAIVEYAYEWG